MIKRWGHGSEKGDKSMNEWVFEFQGNHYLVRDYEPSEQEDPNLFCIEGLVVDEFMEALRASLRDDPRAGK